MTSVSVADLELRRELAERYAGAIHHAINRLPQFPGSPVMAAGRRVVCIREMIRACERAQHFRWDRYERQRRSDRVPPETKEAGANNARYLSHFLNLYGTHAGMALAFSLREAGLDIRTAESGTPNTDIDDITARSAQALRLFSDKLHMSDMSLPGDHRHRYGPLVYDHAIYRSRLPARSTAHLAYLVYLLRFHTTDPTKRLREPGAPMPQTGQPSYSVAAAFTNATFSLQGEDQFDRDRAQQSVTDLLRGARPPRFIGYPAMMEDEQDIPL